MPALFINSDLYIFHLDFYFILLHLLFVNNRNTVVLYYALHLSRVTFSVIK
jgi:hypothetical protein